MIPEKIKQWEPLIRKWEKQIKLPVALVMAVITVESGGNSLATRYEPMFEKKYIKGSSAWLKRCKEIGVSTKDAATSYGLMQMMFTTAWGYGCKSVDQAMNPDQNIRFGMAHLAMLVQKYGIEAGLAAYNGGDGAVEDFKAGKTTRPTEYSKKAMDLFRKYEESLNG